MSKHRNPLDDLFGSFEDAFGDLFGKKALPSVFASTETRVDVGASTPPKSGYHSVLSSDGMTLGIDLPGISPRDVTLWVTNTQVIVKGPTPGRSGTFTHRYTIAADFDLKTATATMANGQLIVRIGRGPSAEPRRVAIEYASGLV
jgi:HSP20 family molecular chaperone IbpA